MASSHRTTGERPVDHDVYNDVYNGMAATELNGVAWQKKPAQQLAGFLRGVRAAAGR